MTQSCTRRAHHCEAISAAATPRTVPEAFTPSLCVDPLLCCMLLLFILHLLIHLKIVHSVMCMSKSLLSRMHPFSALGIFDHTANPSICIYNPPCNCFILTKSPNWVNSVPSLAVKLRFFPSKIFPVVLLLLVLKFQPPNFPFTTQGDFLLGADQPRTVNLLIFSEVRGARNLRRPSYVACSTNPASQPRTLITI